MTALIFQLFAVLCGFVEAVLYDKSGADAFTWNEHVALVAQRAMVVLTAAVAVGEWCLFGSWGWLLVQVPVAVLLFSFAHNNAYNFTRLWLTFERVLEGMRDHGDAPTGWRWPFDQARAAFSWHYQSTTSTARFEFSARERNQLAFIGLAVLIAAACLPLLR